MLGAITGDIVGSVYEFDNVREKDFPLFTEKSAFTDDTVMTVAVSEAVGETYGAVAEEEDGAANLFYRSVGKWMQRYGRNYPERGYGLRFSEWLRSASPEPYNSFGNGSAMRVSSVGWAYGTLEQTLRMARISAMPTHNHPEGIKGAEAVAAAIYLGRTGSTKEEIAAYVTDEFGYGLYRTVDEVRETNGFDETCQGSVPEAFACFLEGEDFEAVLRNAVSIGGDSDTIAAIACSMAEPLYPIGAGIMRSVLDIIEAELPRRSLGAYFRFVKPYMEERGWPRIEWPAAEVAEGMR